MITLIKILIIVYFLAINVYAYLLLTAQKKAHDEGNCANVRDGSLFITGLLGGATAIYIAMFIYKYRLRSLFLMISMPVLIVINFYFIIMAFLSNFGFIVSPSALLTFINLL